MPRRLAPRGHSCSRQSSSRSRRPRRQLLPGLEQFIDGHVRCPAGGVKGLVNSPTSERCSSGSGPHDAVTSRSCRMTESPSTRFASPGIGTHASPRLTSCRRSKSRVIAGSRLGQCVGPQDSLASGQEIKGTVDELPKVVRTVRVTLRGAHHDFAILNPRGFRSSVVVNDVLLPDPVDALRQRLL